MKSYHLTQEQALEIASDLELAGLDITVWESGYVEFENKEALQSFVNAALDQVLGEPVAYQTPLRYGSRVSHNKPVKPDDWDDDFITWYCRPLYAPKEQS